MKPQGPYLIFVQEGALLGLVFFNKGLEKEFFEGLEKEFFTVKHINRQVGHRDGFTPSLKISKL